MDVVVIAGSGNDIKLVKPALEVLEEFEISYEFKILSAHRTPEELVEYIKEAENKGAKVFIAMAGFAAHLAGVIAAYTTLPVIGVPLATSVLSGFDALLSMVQMPSGVPVAVVGVNQAKNAAYLAVSILSIKEPALKEKLKKFRKSQRAKVLEANKA